MRGGFPPPALSGSHASPSPPRLRDSESLADLLGSVVRQREAQKMLEPRALEKHLDLFRVDEGVVRPTEDSLELAILQVFPVDDGLFDDGTGHVNRSSILETVEGLLVWLLISKAPQVHSVAPFSFAALAMSQMNINIKTSRTVRLTISLPLRKNIAAPAYFFTWLTPNPLVVRTAPSLLAECPVRCTHDFVRPQSTPTGRW